MSGGDEPETTQMTPFLTRIGNAGMTVLISVSILSFSLAAWNITGVGA